MVGMGDVVLIVVPDLMFQPRIAGAAQGLALKPRAADTQEAALAELASAPALVVIDIHAAGIDANAVIAAARAASIPVLAFGRHTAGGELRAARAAGADRVVPRSQLVEELPQLISDLVAGPAAT